MLLLIHGGIKVYHPHYWKGPHEIYEMIYYILRNRISLLKFHIMICHIKYVSLTIADFVSVSYQYNDDDDDYSLTRKGQRNWNNHRRHCTWNKIANAQHICRAEQYVPSVAVNSFGHISIEVSGEQSAFKTIWQVDLNLPVEFKHTKAYAWITENWIGIETIYLWLNA